MLYVNISGEVGQPLGILARIVGVIPLKEILIRVFGLCTTHGNFNTSFP